MIFLRIAGIILLLINFVSSVYSQDKEISKTDLSPKDTIKINFNQNKIHKFDLLSNLSDTSGIDAYIWNDKRNLQEIVNEKSGFFAYFM